MPLVSVKIYYYKQNWPLSCPTRKPPSTPIMMEPTSHSALVEVMRKE